MADDLKVKLNENSFFNGILIIEEIYANTIEQVELV
jgi:hypothetical protein